MKKTFKRTSVILVLALALIGGGTLAAASAGYIKWNGTDAYNNILVTLQQITNRGEELKTERDGYKGSNEQLANQLKDKDNVIKDKENQIKDKENEIEAEKKRTAEVQKQLDELKKNGTEDQSKLTQAEKDMKDVEQKAKAVLDKLK